MSMEFKELTDWLDLRLREPLPGKAAQLKMSSLTRFRKLMKDKIPANAIESGVLILLYPKDNDAAIVLMRRPDYRGVHGGQISLPGGKRESADKNIIDTALREAQEEIGINPSEIVVQGCLTPMYIPPSNFIVTPVVGFQTTRPTFIPDPKEVAGIIEIGLMDFLNDRNIQMKKTKLSFGISLKVCSFYINENVIWGATAMILNEFREILLQHNIVGMTGL